GAGGQRQVHGPDGRAVRRVHHRDVASASQRPCGRRPLGEPGEARRNVPQCRHRPLRI
ncbi:MAG: hypothetical protein AVDCRST_MAG01-01-4315, partial [uncultured Rubrobacteraceae bacterium]